MSEHKRRQTMPAAQPRALVRLPLPSSALTSSTATMMSSTTLSTATSSMAVDGGPSAKRVRTSDRRQTMPPRRLSASTPSLVAEEDDGVLRTQLRQLLDDLKKASDASGRPLATLFLQLPSKKLYPDYYALIQHPIALNLIKLKVDQMQYVSMQDFVNELDLMFNNACTYNVPGSQVYEDALSLRATLYAQCRLRFPAVKLNEMKLLPNQKPPIDYAAFFQAVEDGDEEAFEEISDNDAFNPNYMFTTSLYSHTLKWTPLHAAAYHGRTKLVQKLANLGAKIEQKDSLYGSTPLAWAAYGDQINAARILVRDYNANKEVKNKIGSTPLQLVPAPNHPDWVALLAPEKPVKPTIATAPSAAMDIDVEAGSEDDDDDYHSENKTSSSAAANVAKANRTSVLMTFRSMLKTPIQYRNIRTQEEINWALRSIYEACMAHKDSKGRHYCDIFRELPSKKEDPMFYIKNKHPLCIKMIERRMQLEYYDTVEKFEMDMTRMFLSGLKRFDRGSFASHASRIMYNFVLTLIYGTKNQREEKGIVPASASKQQLQQQQQQQAVDPNMPKLTLKFKYEEGKFTVSTTTVTPPESLTPAREMSPVGSAMQTTTSQPAVPVSAPAQAPKITFGLGKKPESQPPSTTSTTAAAPTPEPISHFGYFDSRYDKVDFGPTTVPPVLDFISLESSSSSFQTRFEPSDIIRSACISVPADVKQVTISTRLCMVSAPNQDSEIHRDQQTNEQHTLLHSYDRTSHESTPEAPASSPNGGVLVKATQVDPDAYFLSASVDTISLNAQRVMTVDQDVAKPSFASFSVPLSIGQNVLTLECRGRLERPFVMTYWDVDEKKRKTVEESAVFVSEAVRQVFRVVVIRG